MTSFEGSGRASRAAAELQKIERYIGAVAESWDADIADVLGRDFYVNWELSAFPEPFVVTEPVAIADSELLPAHDEMLALIRWNAEECQPEIVFECDEMRQQWLMQLSEDAVGFLEQPAVVLGKEEIAYGERLEFIYDLLSWCADNRPFWRVREIGREQFSEALEGIAGVYPKKTVHLMRRMPMRNILKLIGSASQDMADDELSNQLTLPLGGTYSAAVGRNAAGLALPAVIPKQDTPCAILRNLRFLQEVIEEVAETDESLSIPLAEGELLSERGNSWFLRVPLPSGCDGLVEGARLRVQAPGERKPVARLSVDVRERAHVIVRMDWDGPPTTTAERLKQAGLWAEAPRSPHRYVHEHLDHLQQMFFRSGKLPSPALEAALGLSDQALPGSAIDEERPEELDDAQCLAWRAAVQDSRPLALIQGPPGTGKTHVLERTLRTLVERGKRVLLIAPSHAAVDNVCRRVLDQPILRLGRDKDRFSPDVAPAWVGSQESVAAFLQKRKKMGGSIYAGTPLGLLRAPLVEAELDQKGPFDVLVIDEAGMAPVGGFLLCVRLARRAVLYGDHQQLPPFPLTPEVEAAVRAKTCAMPEQWTMVSRSALEWLAEARGLPITMLRTSYRCHNPRLMRFSSVLFYDAAVRASPKADYFQLSWDARQAAFPAATLRMYDTSQVSGDYRREVLSLDGGRPGIENRLEAAFCCGLVYRLLRRLPLSELSVIAPYRRQVRLIRRLLSRGKAESTAAHPFSSDDWSQFIHNRVATVDSFQGNESDAVIICYVRSNDDGFIGFVDDPNRINVAHSRCRRELHVVGDLDTLCRGDRGDTFERLRRTMRRDGELVPLDDALAANLLARCGF